ncbi:Na+/H+ antiporter NhaC family protein [Sporosarcina sp. SAFN-015]|uniref:Na+/H+ antiporter NhaC family protein n=1 Tax=Sporosarcina sp. SAFN-015 TaxID=3387274 RepID=UPI003F7D58A2
MGNQHSTLEQKESLKFYGGVPVLLIPFAVMFIGILWLGISGAALPEAFWPMILLGIFVGLLLAKNKKVYVEALIEGITSKMLAIMLLAWFMAGIMAKLLSEAELVQGLVWVFLEMGVSVAWFPLIVFLITSLISMSTGTAVGTLVAVSPILFPVGYLLGADPVLIIGAIIGGSFVGDNLAPISDTTIVSAYSQGTTIDKVVKSRLKYAAVAGMLTLIAYVYFAITAESGGTVTPPDELNPLGLVMIAVPLLLLFLMWRGKDLVEALLYANVIGILLALSLGLINVGSILMINREEFTAGGIIIDGVMGMVGVAVFTIFLMGMIGTLNRGHFLDWLMEKASKVATTPRRAELTIVIVALFVNALTTAGTPTMVMLGDFVRRLGHKFKITPWRRGNLLDACSTSIIGFLPYSVAVLIPFAFVGGMVDMSAHPNFTPVGVAPFVFYCIAMVFVMLMSAFTGFGRDYMTDAEYDEETIELYGTEKEETMIVKEQEKRPTPSAELQLETSGVE